MTATPLRAAVIGLGAMGANHARVYAEIDGVELAAVADTDAPRLDAATRGREARGYSDYRRMMAEERIDLLTVAVPTRAHLDVTADVIARGVALLVEKPLAATLAEGERLRDLAAAARVPLTEEHHRLGYTRNHFDPYPAELRGEPILDFDV